MDGLLIKLSDFASASALLADWEFLTKSAAVSLSTAIAAATILLPFFAIRIKIAPLDASRFMPGGLLRNWCGGLGQTLAGFRLAVIEIESLRLR